MQGMQLKAAQLPEYGGNSSGLGEARIQASRAAMDEMKVLLNEVLAFEEGFGYTPVVRTTETDADQSTATARRQLLDMRKQNNEAQ